MSEWQLPEIGQLTNDERYKIVQTLPLKKMGNNAPYLTGAESILHRFSTDEKWDAYERLPQAEQERILQEDLWEKIGPQIINTDLTNFPRA